MGGTPFQCRPIPMAKADELINQLQQESARRQEATRGDAMHADMIKGDTDTQSVILKSFQALVDYLGGATHKVEVQNHLKQIGTPDALKVAQAVDKLHATVKAHDNNPYLSDLQKVMDDVLSAINKLPTEQVDNSQDLGQILEAIKNIKMVVEAPKIDVKPTPVNVEAPDFKPLVSGLKSVQKQIASIAIPDNTKDLTALVNQMKKMNTLFNEFLDSVPSGGGGGGSSMPSYIDTTGNYAPANLDEAGNVKVSTGGTLVPESYTSIEFSNYDSNDNAGTVVYHLTNGDTVTLTFVYSGTRLTSITRS